MLSHTIVITKENGKEIVRRYWDLHQIHSDKDARQVEVGDIIEYKEVSFRVTYLGKSKHDNHRAWVGRIFGAQERWGLKDNDVIAWGPKGMASNFAYYDDGNFYDFCVSNNSYLWVG
jgi:hypothetical protein